MLKEHLYVFENRCVSEPELALGDGTQTIILNTKGTENDIPLALKMFLDYIETGVVQDDFTAELETEVDKIRQNYKWRDEIMTYEQEWENEKESWHEQWKEEGLAEGREQGIAEGRAEGQKEIYIRYAERKISKGMDKSELIDDLIDSFGISGEEAADILESL
ncbi:MAG: hypothetical protein K5750_11225 [Eubacterium sp.]|nr:hypothetical protein [Eubacterium sp.]